MWQAGLFGNHPRAWDRLEDVPPSYQGTLTLRYKGKAGGGFCTYKVPQPKVPAEVRRWVRRGAEPELIYYGEDPPDWKLKLQGELMESAGGWDLLYSTVRAPMRVALAESSRTLSGLAAREALRGLMSPSSFADLEALFERYPGCVVELGVYECEVGCLPGRNTIVWEVRHY